MRSVSSSVDRSLLASRLRGSASVPADSISVGWIIACSAGGGVGAGVGGGAGAGAFGAARRGHRLELLRRQDLDGDRPLAGRRALPERDREDQHEQHRMERKRSPDGRRRGRFAAWTRIHDRSARTGKDWRGLGSVVHDRVMIVAFDVAGAEDRGLAHLRSAAGRAINPPNLRQVAAAIPMPAYPSYKWPC